jgi:hypothetical protein
MKKARTRGRFGWIMEVLRRRLIRAYSPARHLEHAEEAPMDKAHLVRPPQFVRQEEPEEVDAREKVAVLSTHSFDVQRDVARRTITTAKELMKRVPNGRK